MTIDGGKKSKDTTYNLNNKNIEKVPDEKDIGVILDSELSFEKHISEKVNKANSIIMNFANEAEAVIAGEVMLPNENSFSKESFIRGKTKIQNWI